VAMPSSAMARVERPNVMSKISVDGG